MLATNPTPIHMNSRVSNEVMLGSRSLGLCSVCNDDSGMRILLS
ncbi:MAG: hypothetical protein OXF50_11610 [Caldilineaceae bacterium]|nr:hypothetical protein [Caldilineaceae bacterium]